MGPASSPIIWDNLVFIQCDTQADSFVMALRKDTGEVAWKTPRQEFPSWGTPTVATLGRNVQLVTNASRFIRAYDPETGKELWRLGGSSLITAPTPIFADDLIVVVSGRAPERPIFVIKSDARGDVTLPEGRTSSDAILWSRTGRGSYMPTPLIYDGILYVLGNNGVFDAYDLKTGADVYRQRLATIGDGYSASPVASDGKIYLSNEDGDMTVVQAGREFKALATGSWGTSDGDAGAVHSVVYADGTVLTRSNGSDACGADRSRADLRLRQLSVRVAHCGFDTLCACSSDICAGARGKRHATCVSGVSSPRRSSPTFSGRSSCDRSRRVHRPGRYRVTPLEFVSIVFALAGAAVGRT